MSAPTQCDTSEMLIIHQYFRKRFAEVPGLVRAVADGNRERVRVVANHVREVAGGLHNHHHGEDVLIWDQLESRAPACALHVGKMRAQHAAVAEHLEKLLDVVGDWERTARSTEGEAVAAEVEAIRALLLDHVGQEETDILPAVARTFSQKEWDAIGEKARKEVPARRLFIQLGFILDSMPPGTRAEFVKELPPPVRALWWLFGRRQFESHRRALYGEAA